MVNASRSIRRGAALVAVTLLMGMLAACGASSTNAPLGSHGSTGGHSPAATGVASAAATGASGGSSGTGGTGAMPSDTTSATTDGCPAKQPPSAAPSRPADVVASQSSGMDQQITLKQGQVVEIRLNPALRWSLTATASSPLTPTQPNGWYDAAVSACVWRFTASATGSADLAFSGVAICQGGAICPHVVLEQDYTVTVS